MNATDIAAALARRAEQVCRRYLPHGRKQGRYWTCGDARGARGRSLFVRLAPPGAPGKWTDAATGEHGDLLDLIRLGIGTASLKPALDEARAFLAMPAAPAGGEAAAYDRIEAARRLWRACRAIRLPPEWMAVDSTATEAKAREHLRSRFEACYPFHPSTLSVFRRKWSALAQFQQTRGTLAMLAQWISWAARAQFEQARTEPLITLGSAPLDVPEFRAVVLGQLGEQRLDVAIAADLAGPTAHARALDADTKGPLRDIHRRVGAAILFESSGGQVDKIAHLPELRFALGEPEVETTTIDNAAAAPAKRSAAASSAP